MNKKIIITALLVLIVPLSPWTNLYTQLHNHLKTNNLLTLIL